MLSNIQDNSSCVYSECNTINESEDILKTYNYKVISIKVFLNITAMDYGFWIKSESQFHL